MTPRRLNLRILLAMGIALALTAAALWAALAVLRNRIDRAGEQEALLYVETRLRQMQQAFGDTVEDYGYWTAAYDAAMAGDVVWLYDNMGSVTEDSGLFDLILLTAGALPRSYSWQAGDRLDPQGAVLPGPLLAHLHAAVSADSATQDAATGLIRHEGRVGMIGAVLLQPIDLGPDEWLPDNLPLLIGIRYLSDGELAELEMALTLTDLELTVQPQPGLSHLLLRDVQDGPIGYLTWQSRRHGTEVIAALWPLIAGLGLLLVLMSVLIGHLVRANALRLIAAQRRARAQALTDPLTGLANRLAMNERLADARLPPCGAVVYIDLNGFKKINDVLGHAAGDAVVTEFAARLLAVCDPGDLVARVGGDEFAVLLPAVARPEARARALTLRIAEQVLGTFHPLGHPMHLSAAMGVALRDAPMTSDSELVRRADLAMLWAKRARQAEPRLYSPEIEQIASRDTRVEADLRRALSTGQEFSVAYQPIVTACDGRLARVEALARWTSASLGRISPEEFIPLAEASGQIGPLGRLIMEQVCADMARHPDIAVSLNISALQLLDPDFRPALMACVARHGVAAQRLEIEMTESVLVDDPDSAAMRLDALREAGFSTAIDDFGSGYASLGALRRLPFGTLKIDRTFLSPQADSTISTGLIEGIVRIGHAMGQSIICEGVESAAQAQFLAQIGCDFLQGYHFGAPMPLAELLAAFPPAPAVGNSAATG